MKLIKAFMRFFFYHLYHSMAWTYDIVSWTVSLGRWNDWVQAALEFAHGARVLELGFGPGHLQLALHEKGFRPFGLDESSQMAQQATRRLTRRGHQPRLTRGIAQHLPFAATFDTVIATFPSEYIFDPDTLAEIYRVLRPGGQLVVLANATFGGKDFSERVVAWLFRITGQDTNKANLVKIFERVMSPFKESGFEATILERVVRGNTVFFIVAQKQSALFKT